MESEFLNIEYFCEKCQETHRESIEIKFLPSDKEKYPFKHTFIHSNQKSNEEIFTVLTLDSDHNVLKSFTKILPAKSNNPILQEILHLEKDFEFLKKKYKTNIQDLKETITKLQQ